MVRFLIRHETRFIYDGAVTLGPTTVRLRPRDDGAQRVIAYRLDVTPEPMARAYVLDAEGNACERLWFAAPTEALTLNAECEADTLRSNPYEYVVNPATATVPTSYSAGDEATLARFRGSADPSVGALARDVAKRSGGGAADFLRELSMTIAQEVALIVRDDGEALPAPETLARGRGACRDTAVLFIDAARSMGFAARFVSGYQEPQQDRPIELHAWAEVYMLDGGWRGYDPSAGVAVADRHLAVAAGATPRGAAPTEGTYGGIAVDARLNVKLAVETRT